LEYSLILSTATILDSKSDIVRIIQFRAIVTWSKGLGYGRAPTPLSNGLGKSSVLDHDLPKGS
jgi:hypothetical protein